MARPSLGFPNLLCPHCLVFERPVGKALIMGPVLYGADFEQRPRDAGFEVDANDHVRHLSADEVARYGLDPDEILYACT
jgi:hypothetical protein